MILKKEHLLKMATNGRGWKNSQLEILGVPKPLKKGWQKKIIGKKISEEDYRKCLYLKGINRKNSSKEQCSCCGKMSNKTYSKKGHHGLKFCWHCWEKLDDKSKKTFGKRKKFKEAYLQDNLDR